MKTHWSLMSRLRQVLNLKETPRRTALAFALGIFIAFFPVYPHTVIILIFAWSFRLNLLALFAAASLNNPWTMVPSFNWKDLTLADVHHQILPYAVPFALGGLVLSVIGGLVTYPAAYFFLSKYHCRSTLLDNESLPPRHRTSASHSGSRRSIL
jgi:uncharacterized protein (DUF2062 family)